MSTITERSSPIGHPEQVNFTARREPTTMELAGRTLRAAVVDLQERQPVTPGGFHGPGGNGGHPAVGTPPPPPPLPSLIPGAGMQRSAGAPAADGQPTPQTALTVHGGQGDGAFTIELDGGIWTDQAALVGAHPELKPIISHPELMEKSLQYVAELQSGKTVQEILGDLAHSPTAVQDQQALQQAFELLGISDRQITALAKIAADNGVTSGGWLLSSPPNETGEAALAALREAGRMRVAADSGAGATLQEYAKDAKTIDLRTNAELPGLSVKSFLNAIQDGYKTYFAESPFANRYGTISDIVFGGPYIQHGILGDSGSKGDFAKQRLPLDGGVLGQEGRATFGDIAVTARADNYAKPPTNVEAAAQAFRTGATIQDVDQALKNLGLDDATRTAVIQEALGELGISNDDITRLAKEAAPEIAALGGPDGVREYLNDPNSKFDHPAVDKLFAALQARMQLDGTTTGMSLPTDNVGGDAVLGYGAASAAAKAGGLTVGALESMPIGIEEDDDGDPATPAPRVGAGRTELSVQNETAVNAHADKGRELLGLSIQPEQALSPEAISGVSATLATIFSSTSQEWDAGSVNQLLNGATTVVEAISSAVAANEALQATKGLPTTLPDIAQFNAEAINAALKEKGLGNITCEQIVARLKSAFSSPAYLQYIQSLPDSERDAMVESDLSLLKYFDPTSADAVADALSSAQAPTGMSLPERNQTYANLTSLAANNVTIHPLMGKTREEKTAQMSMLFVTILGALRQGTSAAAKGPELTKLFATQQIKEAFDKFVMALPDTLTPDQILNQAKTFLTSVEGMQAGPNVGGILQELEEGITAFEAAPNYAANLGLLSESMAGAAMLARTTAVATKFSEGNYAGGAVQIVGVIADWLSMNGAAAKNYLGLSNKQGAEAAVQLLLGAWSNIALTNPENARYKKIFNGVAAFHKNGQANSQAAYSLQSVFGSVVNFVNGQKFKGGILLSRGAFFLNSYLLASKSPPYNRMALPAQLLLNAGNSLVISLHNVVLASYFKGE